MEASGNLHSSLVRDGIQVATKDWLHRIHEKSGDKPTVMAREIGAATSTITRAYYGKTKSVMDIATVRKLVNRYGVAPPPELAGLPDDGTGFAEPQVEMLSGSPPAGAPPLDKAQSVWRVRAGDLTPGGYLPGDYFILDQSGIAMNDGDHVLVNVHDENHGDATTQLRILRRDWLIPLNPATDEILYLRDGRVSIMGVIVRSWRQRR
jgi:hypothetical protein